MNKVLKLFSFYFGWRFLTLLIAWITSFIIPFREQFTVGRYGHYLPYLTNIWGNFDGYHYMEIAERGYAEFEQPFFPLYPILIGTLARTFDWPYLFSAQFISNLCFIFAFIVIYKLLVLDKKESLTTLFYLVLILFPTSMFYGAAYNDSLFLLLATSTLYLGRQKKWFAASVVGGLATLARLNGLALLFFLIVEYIGDLKKIREKLALRNIFMSGILSTLIIPFSFLGYYLYTQATYGRNLLFASMKIWRQEGVVFPLQVFWRYLKIFFFGNPHEFVYWVAVAEFGFVILYIFLLIFSFKKIRRSYWVFAALSLLIPALTGSFVGMPRYGLHLYPIFLSLTLFLGSISRWQKILYFLISLALSFFYIGFFTRGYFVS